MTVDAAAEEQFGPYLVYERLGIGGMATVHRALEHGAEGFERTVALKRLLPHLAEDASFIKSFVREAKLASILNHVNIVQIYELGRVGPEYFISMEYIDGRDLRRILRHARKVTGPPPLHVTVGLMAQLCDALDYAHSKADDKGQPLGLVHRDISPSNLIVTSGGHLKVIDFGIAKAQLSHLVTQTGRVKGKLAYMAPEAVVGSKDLDARSDIWATGVIIHELLTARPLFASKNEYQTLLKVQRGDIMPPSTFNQACPPELDALVFRALERDPDQRYATAGELREELHDLKRQYNLQTGARDIASWLDWAFGLEAPTVGFSGNTDSVGPLQTPRRQKTPLPPRNKDEDEAVEVVWGKGDDLVSEDGAVILEEVPDVSEKHRMRRATSREHDGRDSMDDIPTPLPTHGTMPSIYGSERVAAFNTDPAFGRGTNPPPRQTDALRAHRSTTGQHALQRASQATPTPQRSGRATGRVASQKTSEHLPAQLPAPPPGPKSDRIAAHVPGAKSDRIPVARAPTKSGSVPVARPAGKTAPVPVDTPQLSERMAAQRQRDTPHPFPKEEPFGADTPRSAQIADGTPQHSEEPPTLVSIPALPDSEPETSVALRPLTDSEPTTSPSLRPVPDLPEVPVVRFARSPTIPPDSAADSNRPMPSTKPGMPPVRAATTPRPRQITDAPTIGASIAARAMQPARTGRTAVLALGATAAAAIVLTVLISRSSHPKAHATVDEPTEPPKPGRTTGTVKFVTEPADAEIWIEGKAAHTGSPWSDDLPAGVHQIEIHHTGYKAWLTSIELSSNEMQTLRVVLEPLAAAQAAADATLMIRTTPAGLELLIDDKLFAQRTPVKTPLKPGAHKLAIRQNGVEVWHEDVTAEPSSNYEFNPSFTEDKQRERAERIAPVAVPPPKRSVPPGVKTSPTPPSPGDIKPEPAIDKTDTQNAKQDTSSPWIKPGFESTPPPPTPPTPEPSTATAAAPTPAAPPPKPAAPAAPAPQHVATAPPPPPAPARPEIVPPNMVTKISGDPPSVDRFRNLPDNISVKLCIDEAGKVSSADMITKGVDSRVAADIKTALRTWRYKPYLKNNAAVHACFAVQLRAR